MMDLEKNLRNDVIAQLDNRFQDIMDKKRHYHGHLPLIDLGVGEDKALPDLGIIHALVSNLHNPENHKYSDNGTEEFKTVATDYLSNKGVPTDDIEVLPIMGAKSILAILPTLFISRGDLVMTTRPSYIVLEKAAHFYGGDIFYLDITQDDFLNTLERIPIAIWERTKLLNLNFPHNPTGRIIPKSIYAYLIAKAKQYNFVIINDAAYIDINYEYVPCFLTVEGAEEVGVEIFTLSKSYNMTGYRLGFIAGNKTLIKMIAKLKDCYDSGQFIPIQKAGVYALKHPEINEELKVKYFIRLKKLAAIFEKTGLVVTLPKATFYLYIETPQSFLTAGEFATFLLEKCGIMTIPYDECGHYIRLSATFTSEDDEAFYKDLANRLGQLHFDNL